MRFSFVRSISFRVGATLLVIIVIAELAAGIIWFQSNASKEEKSLRDTMVSITTSAVDTYNYFYSLPIKYRHLILNQLRELGGTRFFISINNRELPVKPLDGMAITRNLTKVASDILHQKVNIAKSIQVAMTRRDDMRIFNSGIKLEELPEVWAKYSLALGELDLPIIVIQIEMSDKEWFYVAAVLPVPFSSLEPTFIDKRQAFFLGMTSIMLMLCTAWILQREIRPIKSLAKAATLMGGQFSVPEVKEEGSKETRTAVHAFNKMNRRVRSYIRDREMLFGAISHDLKTPLACLKLRTEMLDDEATKQRFEKLLNEFDVMLNGALQCIRDTNIHEEPEWIDVTQLLDHCRDYYNRNHHCVTIHSRKPLTYLGKPLAIKRCIYNVVDNAVMYGKKVDISINDNVQILQIIIRDYGPGIDKKLIEKVFEPYFRAHPQDESGSGLGLTIARSIARSHGGDLKIMNHPEKGLEVHLIFTRD
ncbi:ATP-binding protein [Photobacterium sp.]|uniref:ATP-binding protein n=1 Tax=Photobacterium sp. TaxID=660 RepID=UPI00299F471A|nr:ATP-binding protein [Photobacterium sp.]MDX1301777.1 ATP-binding protein [Photobacterium sp.]